MLNNLSLTGFLKYVFFGFVLALAYEYLVVEILKRESFYLLGRRLHHSLYGVACFGLYGVSKKAIWLGIGLGIIIQHTLTDGLRFISF